MKFKKALKEDKTEYNTLINSRVLSVSQMKTVNAIIAYYDTMQVDSKIAENTVFERVVVAEDVARYAKRIYRRSEMHLANVALFNKKSAAYFITKNKAFNFDHYIHLALAKVDAVEVKRASKELTQVAESTDVVTQNNDVASKSKKK